MSTGGKLRAGFGALGLRPPPPGHEEPVEEFVRRNLGDEVFERLMEPFLFRCLCGINGGTFKTIQERSKNPKPPRDPRLPTPKGQSVGSLRKGLAMLPDAIATRLGSNVKLFWKLSSIIKLENGGAIYSSSLFLIAHLLEEFLLLNYVGGATNSGIVCKVRKLKKH
ncbi:hypothetical protein OIU78_015451 [Salix suchowensis]|nr:hypothetical protein OIU78_015451 [Salix suchowensis]